MNDTDGSAAPQDAHALIDHVQARRNAADRSGLEGLLRLTERVERLHASEEWILFPAMRAGGMSESGALSAGSERG